MTLLLTLAAACAATVIWYTNKKARELKISTLCFMYWGASLMWMVDAVTEYFELQAEYFNPAFSDMLNDAFLGVSVIVLGVLIWVATVLISDPKQVLRNALIKK